jgi:hypothetical protein
LPALSYIVNVIVLLADAFENFITTIVPIVNVKPVASTNLAIFAFVL